LKSIPRMRQCTSDERRSSEKLLFTTIERSEAGGD
jgi:hypothetical protein